MWHRLVMGANTMTEALQMYKEARAPRDYKREYAQYHSKPQRVSERSQRNKARRKLGLAKGDPREVDHKNPISNGGSNARSNLRAVSLVENRKKFTKAASSLLKEAKSWERKSTTQGGEATYNVGFRPYGRADVPHPKNKDKKITLQFSREASDKNPRELVQLLDKDSGEVLSHTILLTHGKGMKEVKAMFTAEKHRRQGLGREVMRYAMLKNPSDRFIAKPDPFADQKVSKEGLKKVYASYGFQQTTNPDYMMSLSVEERRKKFTKTASKTAGLVNYLDKKILGAAQKDTRVGRFLAGALPNVVNATNKANQALARGSATGAVAALSKGGTGALTGGASATNNSIKRALDAHKKVKTVTGKVKKRAGQVVSSLDSIDQHTNVDSPYLDYLGRAAGYVGDLSGEILDKVADNPRIPRKPGQPANSDKHSDLFTDENPKGTIHGLGFKTPSHAQKSVAKIKSSGKTHAHKTQAAIAMEQRARSMGKNKAANVYRKFIEEQKRITANK